jgi:hypothetical protein
VAACWETAAFLENSNGSALPNRRYVERVAGVALIHFNAKQGMNR